MRYIFISKSFFESESNPPFKIENKFPSKKQVSFPYDPVLSS